MHREFLDLYNRELQLLNEQARDFAASIPASRSGSAALSQSAWTQCCRPA
jgi:type VI protein secretion system component VasA